MPKHQYLMTTTTFKPRTRWEATWVTWTWNTVSTTEKHTDNMIHFAPGRWYLQRKDNSGRKKRVEKIQPISTFSVIKLSRSLWIAKEAILSQNVSLSPRGLLHCQWSSLRTLYLNLPSGSRGPRGPSSSTFTGWHYSLSEWLQWWGQRSQWK